MSYVVTHVVADITNITNLNLFHMLCFMQCFLYSHMTYEFLINKVLGLKPLVPY